MPMTTSTSGGMEPRNGTWAAGRPQRKASRAPRRPKRKRLGGLMPRRAKAAKKGY